MVLKRIFTRKGQAEPRPVHALMPGRRAYAIGDVHGRVDLLDVMLDLIRRERDEAPELEHHVIFLGDYVDRGPDSAGVIDRLLRLAEAEPNITFLAGNHEDVMVRALDGEREALRLWIRIGGIETVLSYGVSREDYIAADFDQLHQMLVEHVPMAHADFLRRLENWHQIDDYLFVHAGIRPGLPIEEQRRSDLRWIRDDFLNSDADHGAMVVHGHCITDDVIIMPNRIGVDTGAYRSGRLSAVVIEGETRRIIEAAA